MKKPILCLFLSLIALTLNSCAILAVGAVGVVAGTTAIVTTDPRKSNNLMLDNTISNKLQINFALDYSNSNIYVNSYDGVVLLTGQVADAKTKNYVEFETKATPNVKQIYNYLQIRLPQSFASRTRDSLTTTSIKTKLMGLKNLNSNDIKVVTTNNVVYLFGVVSKFDAQTVANTVANIDGVVKVITLFEYINPKTNIK